MQEHGVELKNEQLSISALVRKPLLALRCQLPDKKVRLLCFDTSDILTGCTGSAFSAQVQEQP
jgi:hypothetical protein